MALLAVAIHHVLDAQERVARGLEHAAGLKRPRDRRRRREEPKHLHGVTSQPAGQDRQPKALAGPRPRIRQDLRDGQRGLDRQADDPDRGRVRLVDRGNWSQQEFADDQAGEQGEHKLPVPAPNVRPSNISKTLLLRVTHGFGDLHCQKLKGRCVSFARAKGTAASPPLEYGAGRWSNAIFSRTTCIATMMTDWMRSALSYFAPG